MINYLTKVFLRLGFVTWNIVGFPLAVLVAIIYVCCMVFSLVSMGMMVLVMWFLRLEDYSEDSLDYIFENILTPFSNIINTILHTACPVSGELFGGILE